MVVLSPDMVPPSPIPADMRSNIVFARAQGHSWDLVGAALGYDSGAIRRACENDPEFAAAQEKAWVEVTWEGEADGMRRLRLLANTSEDEKVALKAAEVVVKYARERRRDDTRLACEKLRADTKLAVEAQRAERHAAKGEEEAAWMGPYPIPETPEETQKRAAIEHAARAAEPNAVVYVWGGKHALGDGLAPDASDTRVRIMADWSCPGGYKFGPVYWVVSESVCRDGYPPPVIRPTSTA